MEKKISIKTVFLLMILAAAVIGILFVAMLKIQKVTYEGNEKVANMDEYLFEKPFDRNPLVFWFQSSFLEHKKIPFVEEYEVEMLSLTEFRVTVYEKSIIGCLNYMGQLMYFDKDGIVVEVTEEKIEGVTYVEGIRFDRIVMNDIIPVDDEDIFETVLDVTQMIDHFKLPVERMFVAKTLEVTLYIGQVRVEIGVNDTELSARMADLAGIAKEMLDEPGMLNMKQYDTHGRGYTFKKD